MPGLRTQPSRRTRKLLFTKRGKERGGRSHPYN